MAKFIFLNELYEEGSSENDSVVQAASWLRTCVEDAQGNDAATSFEEKFKLFYEADKMESILNLFLDHQELAFQQLNSDRKMDVEGFFMVVLSLLTRLDEDSNVEDLTMNFCKVLTKSEESAELKLKLLMTLYNMFMPAYAMRYPVFEHILSFSGRTGQFEKLTMYLSHLEEWLNDWDLDLTNKRKLYKELSEQMRKLGNTKMASAYLQKHLELYNDADEKDLATTVEAATLLVRDSLILPVMQVDHIVVLAAVQHLRKTPQSKLVELLDIFLHGTLEEFQNFHKKSADVFTGDINYEASLSKIRLLTLAGLCHGKTELPLAEIATSLQVEESDVESWVVKALAAGVVDGRIDQIRQQLLVKSALQREFKDAEWEFLDSRVDQWIGNLENLKEIIGQVQANNILS